LNKYLAFVEQSGTIINKVFHTMIIQLRKPISPKEILARQLQERAA